MPKWLCVECEQEIALIDDLCRYCHRKQPTKWRYYGTLPKENVETPLTETFQTHLRLKKRKQTV